ncbi:MAG: prolipoprotein diacylglyceryl transferase [Holosporales bacterium]|jgi:phosphatidylglycerol:prolipoprotein diacylglycerol transferase|nr:prolipoprotein diacylglyceryl transferase [Holosporales bacterium]
MIALDVTSLSPVCARVFGVDIYWYGVAYVVSLWLALFYAKRLTVNDVFRVDAFLPVACVGIVVGGRLGHVLFYDACYYMQHVLDILKIRDGGMSFHGGLIGVALGAVWFCRRKSIKFLYFLDVLAMTAPIGLGIGRIANFVNSELYGVPTTLPCGVVFRGVREARHPTQIYEALTEGVLTFFILRWCRSKQAAKDGRVSSIFLICYSVARFTIDFVKDSKHVYGLTVGQWLSAGMALTGVLGVCLTQVSPPSSVASPTKK